ncbi:MAG TPA: SLC13 family permease [Pseudomonadales bacterium]|nr:SLC13 family permease [Pseudomonadales bacterium]
MPALPSPHAAVALLLTGVAFWMFVRARLRIELICLLVIAALALVFYVFPIPRAQTGSPSGMEIAFGGFGHPALVAICCLMIIGRGLVMTGALEPAARVLARLWQFSRTLGMLCTLLGCMLISGFVNDTPVLVLMLPILLNLSQRAGVMASKTLMPVNFAILIGGMATTIGTSTNVLVVSIASDMGLPPIGVFSFTPIVAIAALVAFPYLWLIAPRLLPVVATDAKGPNRLYNAMLYVGERSSIVGATLAGLAEKLHVTLPVGVLRHGHALDDTAAIAAGDRIPIIGTIDQLRETAEQCRVSLAPDSVLNDIRETRDAAKEDRRLAEVAIGGDSTLVGKSVRAARIADRFGIAVLGVHRPADTHLFRSRIAAVERLDVGDILLVDGSSDALVEFERSEGVMVLRDVLELPRTTKAPLALVITAAVIVLAASKLLPIAIAALAGTIAMLATGCVRYENLGRALSVEVIVLVAASIALGRSLEETGAASWLASILALGLTGVAPSVVVGALMVFAMLLTNFVSNTAAAAITTPLAISLATQLSIQPEPLVLAVLFGCNLCYITPMAYQTNLLIMGAAGYAFRDFVRVGLPLALIMIATLAFLLVRHFNM